MATDVEIVNLALVRLGATRITSLSDGSRNANEANAIYNMIRNEVLRGHTWKFAMRRATLKEYIDNVLTITAITKANPGVVTYTGNDPENGDEYRIESIVGMTELNNVTVMVQNVNATSNTFELYDEDGDKIDTSGYATYVSGGTATEQVPHSEKFSSAWVLPADCLRVIQINDQPEIEFEITEKGLFCNEDEVEIQYIKEVITASLFDATFVDAFAWRLAQELAIVITGSKEKLAVAVEMYDRVLLKATALDAKQRYQPYPVFSRYKDSRR